MTLPFRRRHHDSEAGHDRARTLMSEGLLVTLDPDDGAWLTKHLDGCAECGRDWKAFRADRRLLRTLRDQPPEPPRDLWARTSAALDREAERRGSPAAARAPREQRRQGGWRALPLGAAAGALVLAVVFGWRIVDPQAPLTSAAPGTNVAVLPTPAPTGVALPEAAPVAIFRETANGSWELVYKDVKEVCPKSNRSCVPKPPNEGEAQPIDLGDAPSQIALAGDQLVIGVPPTGGNPGKVLVVPVAGPGETPSPIVTDPPSSPPSSGESPSPPTATPGPTPDGAIEIATGVRVVGAVAYSEDGRWLAFSAVADGSTGPDLYLWSPGQPVATAVTSDHQTYFSSWHDGAVLASRVEIRGEPTVPDASAEPDATDKPGKGNQGGGNQGGGKPRATEVPTDGPVATAGPSSGPDASAAPLPVEGRPISFLLDPESLERTDLTRPDVWLPVLDPAGRFVVYWSGTLRMNDGRTWALGTGELVLDRWSTGADPEASDEPASNEPGASVEPSSAPPILGPSGLREILVPGLKATFEASFDPDGARLAIWVGEALDEEVGRLHLLVLDPDTGAVEKESPLQGEAALRRFIIDDGRLAWVTPRGQDGKESIVQVLGWKGDEFGEIETEPGSDLYLP